MTEEKWTCPKCKQVYLRDNKEAYCGIEAVYHMTCFKCRRKTGELVLLENELGTRIRMEQEMKEHV